MIAMSYKKIEGKKFRKLSARELLVSAPSLVLVFIGPLSVGRPLTAGFSVRQELVETKGIGLIFLELNRTSTRPRRSSPFGSTEFLVRNKPLIWKT